MTGVIHYILRRNVRKMKRHLSPDVPCADRDAEARTMHYMMMALMGPWPGDRGCDCPACEIEARFERSCWAAVERMPSAPPPEELDWDAFAEALGEA